MFERLWVMRSRRKLARAALLATVAMSVWAGDELDAWGQLRSGRTNRPLYHDQVQSEPVRTAQARSTKQTSAAPSSVRSRTNARSRVVQAGADYSIVEQSQGAVPGGPGNAPAVGNAPGGANARAAQPHPSAQPSAIQPVPQPLPMADDVAPYDEQYGGYPAEVGHGSGCSCGHCGGGEPYYADLAPGCCDTSCGIGVCDGPIARLLGRLSIRTEVPLFWRRGMGLPPLVTTSPTGTPATTAGQIGQTTTEVLLGNEVVGQDLDAGVRISVGTWLDNNQYRGLLVRYTDAGNLDTDVSFNSNTSPILARPFNNISSGTSTPDTQLVAFPGETTGNIRVRTESEVDGFDIVIRRLAYRDRFTRVDWLYGYQHNHIEESLRIDSNTTVTGNVPPLTGTSIAVTDLVRTTNNFSGGVIGLMSTRQFACWKFEAMARMGLGSLERRVETRGATTTTSAAGVSSTEAQGLFARNTNNRPFQDDTFTVVPEFALNAGYYLTPNIDFLVGYNYLLIPKVAQPGRQIDTTVNLSDPLSGSMRPQVALDTQKYWMHSLNLGAQWRY